MSTFGGGLARLGGGAFEEPEEERGFLLEALSTLARPGWALRNLLSGDLEGALGQAGVLANQLASVPFTGGASLVNPDISLLGASEYFGGPGVSDLAPRETEREFSDVLDEWGIPSPDEGWGRVALDIGGGILTDPLTLFTGGTSSIGRGALTGATREGAEAALLKGLQATQGGRGALQGAGGSAARVLDDFAPTALRPEPLARYVPEEALALEGPLEALHGPVRKGARPRLLPLDPGAGGPRRLYGPPQRVPTQLTADDLLGVTGAGDELAEAIGGMTQRGLLNERSIRIAGQEIGVEAGSLVDGLATLANPFRLNMATSLLGGVAGETVAGPLGGLLGTAAGAALSKVPGFQRLAGDAGDTFVTKLIDKFEKSGLPQGIKDAARQISGRPLSLKADAQRQARMLFGDNGVLGSAARTTDAEQTVLGDVLSEVHTKIMDDAVGRSEAGAEILKATQKARVELAKHNLDLTGEELIAQRAALAARTGNVSEVPALLKRAGIDDLTIPLRSALERPALARQAAQGTSLTFEELRNHAISRVAGSEAFRGGKFSTDEIGEMVDFHLDRMRTLREQLIERGVYKQREWRDAVTGDTIRVADGGAGQGEAFKVLGRTVDDKFRLRNTETGEEITRKLGGEVDDAGNLAQDYDILNDPKATRLADQFYVPRRVQPWVEEALEASGKGKRIYNAWKQKRRTTTAAEHEATIQSMLTEAGLGDLAQGRPLVVRNLPDLTLDRWSKGVDDIARKDLNKLADDAVGLNQGVEIRQYVDTLTKGIETGLPKHVGRALAKANRVFKTGLTTVNPAFHFRNWLGTLFQSLHDPNITLGSAVKTWAAIGLEAPLAFGAGLARRMGFDATAPASDLGLIAQAASGNREALGQLKSIKIGKYDGEEIMRAANGRLLNQNQIERELVNDLMSTDVAAKLGRTQETNAFTRTMQAVNENGGAISSFVEDRTRLGALGSMLEGGVPLEEAITRVNRAYVDYSMQSTADWYVRQAVPFFRFAAANAAPALRAAAETPLGRQIPRVLASNAREQEAATDTAREGFALPLGGRSTLQGLGMPLENAAGLLEALPRPGGDFLPGARRQLAALHPLASAGVSAATGTDLYFGGDYWKPGKAPGAMGDAIEALGIAERGPDGEVRLSPAQRRLFEAMPLSRQLGDIRKFSDEDGELASVVTRYLTGAYVRDTAGADQAQELLATQLAQAARMGDVSVYQRFYQNVGQTDPEIEQILKAFAGFKEQSKAERAGQPGLR